MNALTKAATERARKYDAGPDPEPPRLRHWFLAAVTITALAYIQVRDERAERAAHEEVEDVVAGRFEPRPCSCPRLNREGQYLRMQVGNVSDAGPLICSCHYVREL